MNVLELKNIVNDLNDDESIFASVWTEMNIRLLDLRTMNYRDKELNQQQVDKVIELLPRINIENQVEEIIDFVKENEND